MDSDDRTDSLREWACGTYPLEAAAELVIRAAGGRLLRGPWVLWDDERARYWFDAETAAENGGYLSGGERRLLDIAVSLVDREHPVDLGDAVSGLDRESLALVLASIAHAGGSHEHCRMVWEEGEGRPNYVGSERLDSLYPWPEDA